MERVQDGKRFQPAFHTGIVSCGCTKKAHSKTEAANLSSNQNHSKKRSFTLDMVLLTGGKAMGRQRAESLLSQPVAGAASAGMAAAPTLGWPVGLSILHKPWGDGVRRETIAIGTWMHLSLSSAEMALVPTPDSASQCYKITDWLGLERISADHLVQPTR